MLWRRLRPNGVLRAVCLENRLRSSSTSKRRSGGRSPPIMISMAVGSASKRDPPPSCVRTVEETISRPNRPAAGHSTAALGSGHRDGERQGGRFRDGFRCDHIPLGDDHVRNRGRKLKLLLPNALSARAPGPSKLWIWGSPVRAGAAVPTSSRA